MADLYRGKGKIDPKSMLAVTQVAQRALNQYVTSDETVDDLNAQIDAMGAARDAALQSREVADVLLSRIAFVTTHPKTPRGAVTLAQGALAKRLGVTRARVNQMAAVGYASYLALGAPKSGEVTASDRQVTRTLEAARKAGSDVLDQTVTALAETVKAQDKSGARDVRSALDAVVEARRTEPVTVKVKAQHGRVEAVIEALTGADVVIGTEEERTALLAALQRAANAVAKVTLTDPPVKATPQA